MLNNIINISWEQRKLGEVETTFTSLSGKTSSDFDHEEASFITYMIAASVYLCFSLMDFLSNY